MPRLQTPNALLFLSTIFRPHLLRPDIRVPNIAHVDYKAFRRAGFNAVVIDKDNCLTYPERDELWPPLQTAWSQLLAAFEPGKVLIVSNSAGTNKDPGGLAVSFVTVLSFSSSFWTRTMAIAHLPRKSLILRAESVTHHLRTPILLHPTPKPACSSLILQYFRGELSGRPQTLASDIRARNLRLSQEEWDDKDALVRMFTGLAEGKIRGEGGRAEGDGVGGRDLIDPVHIPGKGGEGKEVGEEGHRGVDAGRDSTKIEAGTIETHATPDPPTPSTSTEASIPPTEPLRILVIGDRLFTDTILANRLRRSLGAEHVVSIHTTLLPDPPDVRFLRWIEAKLSKGRLRAGKEDWGRFVIRDNSEEESLVNAERNLGWRRFIPFRRQWVGAPELGWRVSTWSFWGTARGSWRGLARIGRGLRRGSRWVWARGSRWVQEQRAKRAAAASAASGDVAASQKMVEAQQLGTSGQGRLE